MARAEDVAAAIMEVTELGGGDRISTQKLHKLLYYTQAWHLADSGTPLFSDPIEAWEFGPVVRSIWRLHRGHFFVRRNRLGRAENLSPDERSLVEEVVERYGVLSADRLSQLTHSEAPWIAAREGLSPNESSRNVISVGSIRSAYQRGQIQPQTAVDLAIADNRLEGLETSPDAMPYLLAVARSEMSADAAIRERFKEVLH